MSIFHFYLHMNQLVIPTVVETDDGMYVDDKPVSHCHIDETNQLLAAIKKELEKGNPKVPGYEPTQEPGSVVLEALNLKTWTAFEKQSVMVTCHITDDGTKIYVTGRARDGMWAHDLIGPAKFGSDTSLDEIAAFIAAEVQLKAKTLPPNAPPPLLLAPPPA